MTEPEKRTGASARRRAHADADEQARARRRAQRRHNLTIVGVMVVALALLIGGAVVLVLPMFEEQPEEVVTDYPGPGSGQVEVVIADAAPDAIGDTLVAAEVVATADAFVAAYEANPEAENIQPGSYTLAQHLRAADAVVALLDPANVADLTLTIPAGWRADQVLARVAEVTGSTPAEIEEAAAEVELPEAVDGELEGWLSAGSYTITPDATLVQVLQQMVDRTIEVLDSYEVAADDQESVLIQASIVEAEVADAEDRGMVARVLVNRLDGCISSGRPLLQLDSTVAYGLGIAMNALTLEDLGEDTPYNTYLHEGLPPSPINSPSEESIQAVLNPTEGPWCYFITVDPSTGDTRFTDDPVEHEENRELYREWLAEQSAPPSTSESATDEG